ncbi:MAG: hypoxanthine phosphoribosyltransferase [Defluviitaleaceae bacterium]|nr:hypoxanthine phosphoribosyltransferase [Defluviitaleaceae bacterium]
MHSDIKEILISQAELEKKAKNLASQINVHYKNKEVILLGLLKGSIIFMGDLIKYLDFPLEIDFMDVSSYYGAESIGDVKILKDMAAEVKNKHILIVEDIIDTGQTLFKIVNLLKERGAETVEIVTMLDKPEARKVKIYSKYVGFEVPKLFVVGYGLDYNEKYRNLPYIGVLKESIYN